MMRFLVALWLVATFAPPVAAGELLPLERGGFLDIVAARQGRPFIVVLWSVGCAPCVQEMPLWRAAMADNPDLDLVLISTDEPEHWPRVRQILARADIPRAETRAFGETSALRLRFEIDRAWQGELPRTFFYDAAGRRTVHVGAISAAKINEYLGRDVEAAQ